MRGEEEKTSPTCDVGDNEGHSSHELAEQLGEGRGIFRDVCIFCLDSDPPPIQSGCACDGGLAHVGCVIENAVAQRLHRGNKVWSECQTCNQDFTGAMRTGLAEAWTSRVCDQAEDSVERLCAATNLAAAAAAHVPPTIQIRGTEYTAFGEQLSDGRGIFMSTEGLFYVGQFNAKREAHGYGLELRSGGTCVGQFADGEWHGYHVSRFADGNTVGFGLSNRGERVETAAEYRDGRCELNGKPCDASDARFTDLRMQALDVEVRRSTAAPTTRHTQRLRSRWAGAANATRRRDLPAYPRTEGRRGTALTIRWYSRTVASCCHLQHTVKSCLRWPGAG
jgi:cytochrome c5